MILLADSEGPDQPARMRGLIWDFAVRICPKTRFSMALSICIFIVICRIIEDTVQQGIQPPYANLSKTGTMDPFCQVTDVICYFSCLAETANSAVWLKMSFSYPPFTKSLTPQE